MPTTPASVGTSVGWKGKLASLPRTKKTVSPTPAPAASTATSVRPAAVPSAAIGCSTSSFSPVRFSSLWVTTTSPTTFASCTRSRPPCHFDRIDDTDDGGIHRTVFQASGHPGRAAADDQYCFADTGVDGVDRHQIVSFALAVGIDGTGDKQLVAHEPGILAGGDNRPD